MEQALPTGLRAIVFDVGETLVDESRIWADTARRAGVPSFTLMAALGSLIERGEDHRLVWAELGVEPPRERTPILREDLYEDALPCLRAVRDAGLLVGVAGNQPEGVEVQLEAAGIRADLLASSAAWGVSKPSAEFFGRIAAALAVEPGSILYVGDRLDNDVLPARDAGMHTSFLVRGPWGLVHARRPEAELADMKLADLDQLTRALSTFHPL